MSDFRLEFTDGVTLQPWEDPADVPGDRPSRLNARAEHPHTRHVGELGVQVELTAIVGLSHGPLDVTLGGVLFTAVLAEFPQSPPPAISSPAGQSSIVRFTPNALGHYTIRIARLGHGSIYAHVDVDS